MVVPEASALNKAEALKELGATVLRLPFEAWWNVMTSRSLAGETGLFVHPVAESAVIAGNATIGAEILEQLPEFDTIMVPFGGGGLASGIGSVMRRLKPKVRMIVTESEAAQPAAAALKHGAPITVPHIQSFVDGMGSTTVLAPMWPLIRQTVDQAAVRVVCADHSRNPLVGGSASCHRRAGGRRLVGCGSRRAGRSRRHCVYSFGRKYRCVQARRNPERSEPFLKMPRKKTVKASKAAPTVAQNQALFDDFAPHLIARLAHQLNSDLVEKLRREGINVTRWRILAVLAMGDGININEIIDRAMMQQSALSRALMNMEKEDYVRRVLRRDDARYVEVFLTERGRALFNSLDIVVRQRQQRLLKGFSPQELATAFALLRRMSRNMMR